MNVLEQTPFLSWPDDTVICQSLFCALRFFGGGAQNRSGKVALNQKTALPCDRLKRGWWPSPLGVPSHVRVIAKKSWRKLCQLCNLSKNSRFELSQRFSLTFQVSSPRSQRPGAGGKLCRNGAGDLPGRRDDLLRAGPRFGPALLGTAWNQREYLFAIEASEETRTQSYNTFFSFNLHYAEISTDQSSDATKLRVPNWSKPTILV